MSAIRPVSAAACPRAAPAAILSHQPARPCERGEVHQHHLTLAFGPPQPATAPTARPGCPSADMHSQGLVGLVVDAERIDVSESHDQIAGARGRTPQGFSRLSAALSAPIPGGSLASGRGCEVLPLPPHFRRAPWCPKANDRAQLHGPASELLRGSWQSTTMAGCRGYSKGAILPGSWRRSARCQASSSS